MVNWKNLIEYDRTLVKDFANGIVSGRQLRERLSFTSVAGEARKALLDNGVEKARKLARKALQR